MKSVAVIGLDGVGFGSYNKVFIEKIFGLIPNRRIICNVRSIPPYTPPIWTSFASGVNPGKHGIAGFIDGKSRRAFSSWDVMYPRIWEMLSMNKISSLIYNLPLTYPLDSMYLKHAIIISGWDSPRIDIFPARVKRLYHHFFASKYVPKDHGIKRIKSRKPSEYSKLLSLRLYNEVSGLMEMVEKFEPKFFFAVFSEIDWLNHHRLSLKEKEYYNCVDKLSRVVGKLIRFLKSRHFDTIFIISDHDFMLYRAKLNLLKVFWYSNPELIRFRALKLDRGVEGVDVFSKILAKYINLGFIQKIISYNRLLRKVIVSSILRLSNRILTSMCVLNSYLPLIRGFYLDTYLSSYRDLICELFRRLGFDAAKREQLFWGRYLNRLPDILFLERSFEKKVLLDFRIDVKSDERLLEASLMPNHSPYGIFLAFGDYINPGGLGVQFKINPWDITPTILAFMDLPVPSFTDGELLDIFSIDMKRIRRRNYLSLWSVMRRLAHLKAKTRYA